MTGTGQRELGRGGGVCVCFFFFFFFFFFFGAWRQRASWGRLLAAAAGPAALACLLAACGGRRRGAGPAGDAAASPAAVRTSPGPGTPAPERQQPTAAAKPLAGITVGIDPGHNGLNGTDPAYINHLDLERPGNRDM